MPHTHQLAAIMFTDIVGYTALMGDDEEKAFDILRKNRLVQRPIIQKYNGRWIKELGDGVLASFSNVTEALLCAGSIQQAITGIQDFQLRIGIHLGEVVFENDDVFGDGVNIAARLLTQAPIGGICISQSVHSNVANKKGITTIFLREEILKNVKEPIRIYEATVAVSLLSATNGDTVNSGKEETNIDTPKINIGKSIAVLPFVNISNDPEQEYFSDGITEEILNSLAHLKNLRVAGRTSSFYFKGKNFDLRKIGQKLNVNTVLEGSVRRQGNKLRITAQLINVEDGYHIWSERYDREMDDIFAIQDEIAFAITEKLKITLLEGEKDIINKNPTENKEAYDLYLKGRFYLNKRGGGFKIALAYFQQSVEIDPEFALPYAGMAEGYAILAFYCVMPPNEVIPKAKQCAEKAIQLNATQVEAYTTLAFISTIYEWDWKKAKKQFQHAFELNLHYATAHSWYGYYLSFIEGKFDESISEAKYASEQLEPLVPISHHALSMLLINAGRYEDAIKESKLAIELDANFSPGFRALGLSLACLKKYEESIESLKKSVILSLRHPWYLVELCWVYSLAGNLSEVQKIQQELIERSQTEFISGFCMSGAAYFSKNYDKAYEWLELAFEQRDGSLFCMKTWPVSSYIREDPRLQPFLKKMNFPD